MSLYGIIFLVTVLLFLYVSKEVTIVTLERNIHSMETETGRLQYEVEQLKIDSTNLKKGSRIKDIAIHELGLIMPEGIPEKLF